MSRANDKGGKPSRARFQEVPFEPGGHRTVHTFRASDAELVSGARVSLTKRCNSLSMVDAAAAIAADNAAWPTCWAVEIITGAATATLAQNACLATDHKSPSDKRNGADPIISSQVHV
jgi:hypothetical protein